jgi:integral membrane protein
MKPAVSLGGTASSLTRYRVMAFIVGIGLAVLCFVGIPLQYAGHHPSVVQIVGPVHGIFYIIYLVACLDLAGRARFSLLQLLGMVCAGWLPLLAFFMERKVTHKVHGLLALGDEAPPGPAASLAATLARAAGRREGPP